MLIVINNTQIEVPESHRLIKPDLQARRECLYKVVFDDIGEMKNDDGIFQFVVNHADEVVDMLLKEDADEPGIPVEDFYELIFDIGLNLKRKKNQERFDWVCSDPDSCQYVRRIDGSIFEFYDIYGEDAEDTCYVVHTTINLDEHDIRGDEFQHVYLNVFDYRNASEVIEQYPTCWEQIIAECIFETDALEMIGCYSEFTGSNDACREYIMAKIGA